MGMLVNFALLLKNKCLFICFIYLFLLLLLLLFGRTRAMQKLLEHLKTGEQKSTAISCIARITVPLTKSLSGHHVIQHVLKFFSAEDNKVYLLLFAMYLFFIFSIFE